MNTYKFRVIVDLDYVIEVEAETEEDAWMYLQDQEASNIYLGDHSELLDVMEHSTEEEDDHEEEEE